MTADPNAAALIEQARDVLEQVSRIQARARPEDLEACPGHLRRALEWLEAALRAIAQEPGRAGLDCARSFERFCHELRKVTALHDQAGSFYFGCMRIISQWSETGYSSRGEENVPALMAPGQRIALEG